MKKKKTIAYDVTRTVVYVMGARKGLLTIFIYKALLHAPVAQSVDLIYTTIFFVSPPLKLNKHATAHTKPWLACFERYTTFAGGHGTLGQEKSVKVSLPIDYPIPETTQKKSYRDPRHFRSHLVSRKYAGPPDSLGFDEKEREILRVR